MAEVRERVTLSQFLSKYITMFDYFVKALLVLSTANSSVSTVSFTIIIGTLVGIVDLIVKFLI